jgi:hypothetical protein
MVGNGGSGKIPAWTPAGGIRGQFGVVGCDPSCRCTGRGRGAMVLEVTGRAGPLWRSSGVRRGRGSGAGHRRRRGAGWRVASASWSARRGPEEGGSAGLGARARSGSSRGRGASRRKKEGEKEKKKRKKREKGLGKGK